MDYCIKYKWSNILSKYITLRSLTSRKIKNSLTIYQVSSQRNKKKKKKKKMGKKKKKKKKEKQKVN